ncbi:MAG: hypothetical protein CL946_03740, partial [Ectothiorhodospiraceae bacterium]|nr:hypothetical protein [Ectothiorhodospiraceae bacterium]
GYIAVLTPPHIKLNIFPILVLQERTIFELYGITIQFISSEQRTLETFPFRQTLFNNIMEEVPTIASLLR